jgi:surfeit locus 1 family protein
MAQDMTASLAQRFRPGWLLTILVACALAVLVTLGTWQVQRMAWKLDLIERIEAGLVAEPLMLPATEDGIQTLDHRPVTTAGTLRFDLAIAKGSQQKGGIPGARLIVPLERQDGIPILVDMGWIPEPVADHLGDAPVPVETLTGTLYLDHPEAKPPFRPANEPVFRRWFWSDTAALRDWTGMPDLAAATLVRSPDGVERTPPIADPPAMTLSNDHLGYALTWYGLALGLLVIYLIMGFRSPDRP